MTALLSVHSLEVAYGNIPALHGIDLEVQKGEIVTLIGANGAGKTTTLRTISGLLKPRKGKVVFKERNITGTKPHVITAMGVCSSWEITERKVERSSSASRSECGSQRFDIATSESCSSPQT